MDRAALPLLFLLFAGVAPATCSAQSGPSSSQPASADIQRQLEDIQRQLAAIREILQSEAKLPVSASDGLSGAPTKTEAPAQEISLPFVPPYFLGRDSPYVVVEFVDLQCPFCIYFHNHTFPTFRKDYIETGKVRFSVADFPLPDHPDATRLALTSICAGEQGKYWQMEDLLIERGFDGSSSTLTQAAVDLDLENPAFRDCLGDPRHAQDLSGQVHLARLAGITSTPTFVVGRVTSGKIIGITIVGTLPPKDFEDRVEAAIQKLAGSSASSAASAKDYGHESE